MALALSLAATNVFAAPITIRYSSWLPPTLFLWKDVLLPWTGEIEKVTEGRVKVEVLPKVVGTAATQFDVIRDGLADMSFITAPYTPGRFTASEFGELPLLGSDASVLARAYDRIYQEHLASLSVFRGVEVLSVFTISPSQIFTNKPVKTVQDIAGLKFRSPTNSITEALTLLSAIPVHKSSTEAFEMLSTGAIDGQVTQANTVVGFNQIALTKHGYLLPGGLSNAVNMIGINPAKWAEISKADQQAILGIAREKLAGRVGDAYAKAENEAFEAMRKAGYTLVEATPEQVAQVREKLKPIEDKWIERAKAAGVKDPAALLSEYRKAIGSKTQ
jgi:TRAP-type C4-dicarboxylate transport system substrate-binding protein